MVAFRTSATNPSFVWVPILIVRTDRQQFAPFNLGGDRIGVAHRQWLKSDARHTSAAFDHQVDMAPVGRFCPKAVILLPLYVIVSTSAPGAVGAVRDTTIPPKSAIEIRPVESLARTPRCPFRCLITR